MTTKGLARSQSAGALVWGAGIHPSPGGTAAMTPDIIDKNNMLDERTQRRQDAQGAGYGDDLESFYEYLESAFNQPVPLVPLTSADDSGTLVSEAR